jgi:hypothetical protein
MHTDYQAVSELLSLLRPQVIVGVVLPLLFVVGLYVAEECGWPAFRSPRLAKVYAKLTFALTATISPVCFLCLAALVFLWALRL